MPLRFNYFPSTVRLHRQFHISAFLRDSPKPNHYETLQIPTNATPSEVKKSFYALSKTHHPDRNPDDPTASQRFVLISEAYATLGTPAKRAAYDRDVLPQHQPPSHSTSGPQHSYHSASPAGGRPASGLSRRRTQFHGPPPSFYQSGGYGSQTSKRTSSSPNSNPSSSPNNPPAGGMGCGQHPYGPSHLNEVPHFDREAHTRTHENHTRRWARRNGMKDGWVPGEATPRSTFANFVFVGGIIVLGVMTPALFLNFLPTKAGSKERKS